MVTVSTPDKPVKYFTKALFVEAVELAYQHDFNQSYDRDKLAELPEDGIFPVKLSFPHDGASRYYHRPTNRKHPVKHVRCVVSLGTHQALQDTAASLFARLPTLIVLHDGNVVVDPTLTASLN